MTHPTPNANPENRTVDVLERATPRDGAPQAMDRRLFMQLLVYDRVEPGFADTLRSNATSPKFPFVLYDDVNDPRGIAVLTWSEDPSHFVTTVRPALVEWSRTWKLRTAMTMFGRTYSTGYEPDLERWLLDRPRETVLNEAWPWAIWYPLRRSGAFAKLAPKEQGEILREHGAIGRAYGAQDLAHDVRLACHGLDANDNEFVIGLIGKDLHPLSHVVQAMRKTRQTAEFISQMGPFFVGRVAMRNVGTVR